MGPAIRLVCAIVMVATVLTPARGFAEDIHLTRYLHSHTVQSGAAGQVEDRFAANPGPATLSVALSDPASSVSIVLNGESLTNEQAVSLQDSNHIVLHFNGPPGSRTQVRVQQTAVVELNVVSRIHFNTNVGNFEQARAFYGNLGFDTVSEFPDTNTIEMAEAIGVNTPTEYDGSQGDTAGGYLLHGELIGLGVMRGGVIDLIEFSIPRNTEPPYQNLNHLGMARAIIHSTDVDADYASLTQQGVPFIAAPATRRDGTRFAIFSDPDGTYYELRAVEGDANPDGKTQMVSLGAINVNVSDFERSRAWYQMFGYELDQRLSRTESLEVATAMGFTAAFEIDGALLKHAGDGSALELIEWISPHDSEPPYPLPVNHLGIHRMAFLTSDIEADVAALKAQGVEFISDITPCCSGPESWGSIVAFYDPDGTIVELAEQPLMGEILTVIRWFRRLFD